MGWRAGGPCRAPRYPIGAGAAALLGDAPYGGRARRDGVGARRRTAAWSPWARSIRPQRLRPAHDPHRLGHRHAHDGSGRPERARFAIIAEDKEIEIAPGIFFPAWTYNGRVPGPTIRVTEGDRVRVGSGTPARTRIASTSTASTRPAWTGCRGRGGAAGRRLCLRVRRLPLRLPPLPLPPCR